MGLGKPAYKRSIVELKQLSNEELVKLKRGIDLILKERTERRFKEFSFFSELLDTFFPGDIG